MRTSYLVAAHGAKKGVIAQCFAASEKEACAAVSALCMDRFRESMTVEAIDTEATPGLWIEGDADYIRSELSK